MRNAVEKFSRLFNVYTLSLFIGSFCLAPAIVHAQFGSGGIVFGINAGINSGMGFNPYGGMFP